MSNAYLRPSSLRYLIESLANLVTICLCDLGTLNVLPRPSAEDLGSAVYSSCVKLIHHIASQAQPYVASQVAHCQDQGNPKEVTYAVKSYADFSHCALSQTGTAKGLT